MKLWNARPLVGSVCSCSLLAMCCTAAFSVCRIAAVAVTVSASSSVPRPSFASTRTSRLVTMTSRAVNV